MTDYALKLQVDKYGRRAMFPIFLCQLFLGELNPSLESERKCVSGHSVQTLTACDSC